MVKNEERLRQRSLVSLLSFLSFGPITARLILYCSQTLRFSQAGKVFTQPTSDSSPTFNFRISSASDPMTSTADYELIYHAGIPGRGEVSFLLYGFGSAGR